MLIVWRALYNLFFPFFQIGIRVLSLFNLKIRASLNGRKNLFADLEKRITSLSNEKIRIWVHVASVGEFEQARPIITELKSTRFSKKEISIIVSFLSVSGYEARKEFQEADLICYLPEDTLSHADRFINLIKPDICLLVRYDFWLNHLLKAKQLGTKLVLIALSLDHSSTFLNPILKSFYSSLFSLFDQIFTVTSEDKDLFQQTFSINCVQAVGDTRFDQVLLRSRHLEKIQHLRELYLNKKVVVCGSTWHADDLVIIDAYKELNNVALVLVPHELSVDSLSKLCSLLLSKKLTFEKVSTLPKNAAPPNVLIVDQMGYLAELYSISTVAYVGGGFGINVHNTLEAAVYGVPVLYGGQISKSREAKELALTGGGFIVDQFSFLPLLQKLLKDEAFRTLAGERSKNFVLSRVGATKHIIHFLKGMIEQRTSEIEKQRQV